MLAVIALGGCHVADDIPGGALQNLYPECHPDAFVGLQAANFHAQNLPGKGIFGGFIINGN